MQILRFIMYQHYSITVILLALPHRYKTSFQHLHVRNNIRFLRMLVEPNGKQDTPRKKHSDLNC